MKKFCLTAILLFMVGAYTIAQDRYWVGASGGNWTTSGNWSLTAGGAGGAGAPTSVQNAIFDGFTGTVNFDAASITINALKVINSANLTLSNPAATSKNLSINDGLSTNQDLRVDATSTLTLTTGSGISAQFALQPFGALIDGTVILKGGGTPASSGGRLDGTNASTASPIEVNGTIETQEASSNLAGGNFKFNAGSVCLIKKSGGVAPNGVWSPTSLIDYRGGQTVSTTAAPLFNGPPTAGFGKFIWNVSNQSGIISIAFGSNTIFQGDFTIANTNGQPLTLAATLNNLTVKGNMLLQSGAAVNMANSSSSPASGTSLTIEGNLTVSSGTFDLQANASGGNSLLKLKGNLTVSAGAAIATTSSGSTNEIELNGTVQQSLAFAGTVTGNTRIKMNNAAGALSSTDITMPSGSGSRLTLTAGNIDMGGNLLFIQNPATTALTGGTASAHIIGKLKRATNTAAVAYLFPVSTTATEVASVKVYPADAASNQFQVEFVRPNNLSRDVSAMPAGIVGISNYYWDITRPSGTSNADLEIVYAGLANSGGITDGAAVHVLHWTGSSPWQDLGGTDAGGGAIDVANVSSFSPFALGSTTQSLPVKLTAFSGLRQNNANVLRWTTATEQNNAGFYVERSVDGVQFNALGFVASRATQGSSSTINYSFTDNAPAGNLQYYRLRQQNTDGKESLSPVIIIQGGKSTTLTIVKLGPNPVKDFANIMLNVPSQQQLTISLFDASGRKLMTQQAMVYEGANTVKIETAALKPGTYIVNINGTVSAMLLKQ